MKIQHSQEEYSIVLGDGTESDIVQFGDSVILTVGGNAYFAHLDSPSVGYGDLKPVVYRLEPQPTTTEPVEFSDEEEDEDDSNGEDDEPDYDSATEDDNEIERL